MHSLRKIRLPATQTRRIAPLSRRFSSLEVESKFVPASNFKQKMNALLRQQSVMSQKNHVWRADKTITIRDTYYDLDNKLFDLGVWFRYRTVISPGESTSSHASTVKADWEAKIRVGGDFINSSFHEIQGEEKLKEFLARTLPNVMLRDLQVVSDLVSIRSGWTIESISATGDERLSIICDEVTEPPDGRRSSQMGSKFRHHIGEVEVSKTISNVAEEKTEERAAELEGMRSRIRGFMEDHQELFSQEKPVGKLSAFQAWREGKRG